MEVYLTGTPLSTKRGRHALDIAPMTKETCTLALVARALQLHQSAPEGLSSEAHRLKVARTCSQLRDCKAGHKVILCWVWLSDGSKHRAAWVERTPENALCGSWERVAWGDVHFRLPARYRAS
jgi:hypothetical protein